MQPNKIAARYNLDKPLDERLTLEQIESLERYNRLLLERDAIAKEVSAKLPKPIVSTRKNDISFLDD